MTQPVGMKMDNKIIIANWYSSKAIFLSDDYYFLSGVFSSKLWANSSCKFINEDRIFHHNQFKRLEIGGANSIFVFCFKNKSVIKELLNSSFLRSRNVLILVDTKLPLISINNRGWLISSKYLSIEQLQVQIDKFLYYRKTCRAIYLSRREKRICKLFINGMNIKIIASTCNISIKTAYRLRQSLASKIEFERKGTAVFYKYGRLFL